MKPNTRTYILFLLLCIIMGGLLYVGAFYFLTARGLNLYYSAEQIAAYHCIISLSLLSIIYVANLKAYKYTAFAFMWAILLRLVMVAITLLPLAKTKSAYPFLEAFFNIIPSFVYICLEAVFAIQLLKNNKTEN